MASLVRIDINAPVVLSFSLLAIVVEVLDATLLQGLAQSLFSVRTVFNPVDILDYFRLFSHVIGHADYAHLFNNLFLILLLGPILEEKYGSGKLLAIIAITALVTGLFTVFFASSGLYGASGIVFCFIILSSIVNVRQRSIPLTFLLVFGIFIGKEVVNSFQLDTVSQAAHIIGGICGAVAGFFIGTRNYNAS